MKVLLVNGSPHKSGCTNRALEEVAATLQAAKRAGVALPEREPAIFTNFVR